MFNELLAVVLFTANRMLPNVYIYLIPFLHVSKCADPTFLWALSGADQYNRADKQ